MDDNWNELMGREAQQFQTDMQRDEPSYKLMQAENEIHRLYEDYQQLTAENAKLREQLAILIEGGQVADELIMMLHGIATHTANSPKVTPPGQDAARQMLAKIAAYHEKYT